MDRRDGGSVPLEDFIKAVTAQLDLVQSALSTKARLGLPLTFAVKDLSIDLKTHVEIRESAVHIRPAGPGDTEASTIRLALTTITRPMMEENSMQMSAEPDEPTLEDAAGADLTPEDRRRLEWAGVHTIAQLRDLQRQGGSRAVEKIAQVPAMRLRAALEKASRPHLSRVLQDRLAGGGTPLLRLRGQNLMAQGLEPTVRIGGEAVRVVHATDGEVLVAPMAHQLGGNGHPAGRVTVETADGWSAEKDFDFAPPGSAKHTVPQAAPAAAGHQDDPRLVQQSVPQPPRPQQVVPPPAAHVAAPAQPAPPPLGR